MRHGVPRGVMSRFRVRPERSHKSFPAVPAMPAEGQNIRHAIWGTGDAAPSDAVKKRRFSAPQSVPGVGKRHDPAFGGMQRCGSPQVGVRRAADALLVRRARRTRRGGLSCFLRPCGKGCAADRPRWRYHGFWCFPGRVWGSSRGAGPASCGYPDRRRGAPDR